jgi:flagella basal body P-ring formation protein FlgA
MSAEKAGKAARIFIFLTVLLSPHAIQNVRAEKKLLQVYLPRHATVSSEVVRLSDAVVLKGDEDMAAKVGDITLGRIARPGGEIIIDRRMVMSRLASNGIYAPEVVVIGADSVSVERKGFVIASEDFIRAAQQEIEKNSKEVSIHGWKPAWLPKEIIADGAGDKVNLAARIAPGSSQSQVRVLVSVMQNGSEVCVREVAFNAQYKNWRAVAAIDIQSGMVIGPDNVRMETFESPVIQRGFTQPYGLTAKRQIKAGSVIDTGMLEATKSPLLVNRNQGVVIRITQPGLVVTAMGQALEDGRASQCVKVRNIDSQRVLLARVNEDGTVEPVY